MMTTHEAVQTVILGAITLIGLSYLFPLGKKPKFSWPVAHKSNEVGELGTLLSHLDELSEAWMREPTFQTLSSDTRTAILNVEAAKRNLRRALMSNK